MKTSLHARAVRIFGADPGGIRWPYGLEDPSRHLKRTDPAAYERQQVEQPAAQRNIVEWAERYGLKESSAGCCPRWLQRSVSRTCPYDKCGSDTADAGWLDHPIRWIKDGKPVAITSAPYGLPEADDARIRWWLSEDPCLRVAYGPGWYGFGTTQVVMWRTDRIPVIEPATSDGQRGGDR